MSGPFTPSVRQVYRMLRLHDRLVDAIDALSELERAERVLPVTPERMAAAVALLSEARRLLSRHPLSATLPQPPAEPPMVASYLFIELLKAQRIVYQICSGVAELSPQPEWVV
jgi:hypothetical protein